MRALPPARPVSRCRLPGAGRLVLLVALLLAALAAPVVAPPAASAQPAGGERVDPAAALQRWDKEATEIQERLETEPITPAQLDTLRATLEAQRAAIPDMIAATEAELKPLRQQLAALGPGPEDPRQESPEVAAERQRLNKRISDVEARLKLLGQADARAAALLSRISELRREHFTRQLMTRGPSPLEPGVVARALASVTAMAADIAGETAARFSETRMDTPTVLRLVLGVVLVVGAVLVLRGVRRAMLGRLARPRGGEMTYRRRVSAGVAATLVRLFMPTLAVAVVFFAAWNSGFLGEQGRLLLRGLSWTALVVIGAYGLSGAFYSPYTPELRVSRLPQDEAIAANRWLMSLAALVGLDRVLVVGGERLGLAIEALSLVNAALVTMGGIALWGYARHLHEPARQATTDEVAAEEEDDEPQEDSREIAIGPIMVRLLRFVVRAVALIAPLLALAGYFAASRFLFYPVVFSGAVIGVAVLLFHAVHDLVDRIVLPAEGEEPGHPSRVRLIPVIVGFLLICGAVPVLALIWGADVTDLANAWRAFEAGFEVGEVTISPLDFFSFLLVFAVGYVLTRILQGVLRRSVLPVTGLDAGGRAAVSAMVFYVGVFLAALVAISATGLDLSNLAIVAGALSVGIGFGLQNIVNNFVSGLILLMERPIKAGDWIQLASGMGYVKQINVRSTEIETFDRASLIVPNSELISSTVTNWTHTNLHGRLIVPVSVSYSADPRKVEEILLEVARGHPMLLRRPTPFVLFRRFGADGLEFEIRGILRDVNWILNVHSDMNYEIARRFTETGIQIPFPQRDLHLRNAGEVAEAFRDSLGRHDGDAAAGGELGASTRRRRRPQEPSGVPDGDGDGDS